MSISTHAGMNTYNRILNEARVNGEPIGPKHHEFNKHRKLYEARQTNLKQLTQARDVKKAKGEIRKARVAINEARERLNAKAQEVSEGDRLRELHRKLQMQKIADGYKTTNDGSEIKSRGNGL